MATAPVRNKRSKPTSSLALSNDGVLPTELLSEVLLRLPANALCRLRVVCRAWRSLTYDPFFIKAHSSRHPLIVGLCNYSFDIQLVDLSACISTWFACQNPMGKLLCSTSPLEPSPFCLRLYHLPSEDRAILAASILGWVSATREYKVLRIHMKVAETIELVQTCDIITLGHEQRWRQLPKPLDNVATASQKRVAIRGVAYFQLRQSVDKGLDDIALFDFVAEEWRPTILRGPLSRLLVERTVHKGHAVSSRLTELNDYLVTVHYNSRDFSMVLWFMVDIENGLWNKQYSLQLYPFFYLYPLTVTDHQRVVFGLNCGRTLKAYDPRTRTWADLATVKDFSAFGVYQGSLLR
ncbi:hypothetical protein ACP70R_022673 [Stipagrostis hirtigluma subsp. patula]